MAIITTLINSPTSQYTDKEISHFNDVCLNEGVYGDTITGSPTFQVTQRVTPALGIDIQVGKANIPYTKLGKTWNITVTNDALATIVVLPNVSGTNRVDALILKMSTTLDNGINKTGVSSLQLIQGVAGGALLTDAQIQTVIGANFIFKRLANITVASGATQILNANIANLLPVVKVNRSINIDAQNITSSLGVGDTTSIFATATSTIAVNAPVSIINSRNYSSNENMTGATGELMPLGTGLTIGVGQRNSRSGVYTLQNFDIIFQIRNSNIYYCRKQVNLSGVASWSNPIDTGISVFNSNDNLWTVGCDASTNSLFFVYAKNGGSYNGTLSYRKATVGVGGVVTLVGTESTAWTDANFKFTHNQYHSLDSEFIRGEYYVFFQNNDISGNYKPTVICNSTAGCLGATWISKVGFPYDIDSTKISNYHGAGLAMAYTDLDRISFIWHSFTSSIAHFCGYKEFNIVQNSWSATNTSLGIAISNDYAMTTNHSTVSHMDGVIYISAATANSGGSSEKPATRMKKVGNNFYIQTIMTAGTYSGSFFSSLSSYMGNTTFGNKLFGAAQEQASYGGNTLGYGISIVDITNGENHRNNLFYEGSNGSSYQYATMFRAVQNGLGIQNAGGAIYTYTNTPTPVNYVWYTKKRPVTQTIATTDFSDKDSIEQFVGFAKAQINAGATGQIIVKGNLFGLTNIIPNKKYYLTKNGISSQGNVKDILIGRGISTVGICLEIQNYEDLSEIVYRQSPTLAQSNLYIPYDGVIRYRQALYNNGTYYRDFYQSVNANDVINLSDIETNNSNVISISAYRRLQRN
jgi:hypothetical protein